MPDPFREVGRPGRFNRQVTLRHWVAELNSCGVKHEARGVAAVGDRLAGRGGAVLWIAAERMALFGEVNSDLMRSAGFQPALNERVIAKCFQREDVRYGRFAAFRVGCASAPAVAAVVRDQRLDPLRDRMTKNDCVISALEVVRAEQVGQRLLRGGRASEDH